MCCDTNCLNNSVISNSIIDNGWPTWLRRRPTVVNHLGDSAISAATNPHMKAAMSELPRGLFPLEPMLELDTTDNRFRNGLLNEPLNIQEQVRDNNGRVSIPAGPGMGIDPDRDFIGQHTIH